MSSSVCTLREGAAAMAQLERVQLGSPRASASSGATLLSVGKAAGAAAPSQQGQPPQQADAEPQAAHEVCMAQKTLELRFATEEELRDWSQKLVWYVNKARQQQQA